MQGHLSHVVFIVFVGQWQRMTTDIQEAVVARFDIKSRWRHNWKSAQVVNSHLVCDPTIRQPGFDLPRQQWSAEPFSHGTDDVSHCWILSPDKTEWRLISATLCGWGRCFVADQWWLMTRIREEEDCTAHHRLRDASTTGSESSIYWSWVVTRNLEEETLSTFTSILTFNPFDVSFPHDSLYGHFGTRDFGIKTFQDWTSQPACVYTFTNGEDDVLSRTGPNIITVSRLILLQDHVL